MKQGFQKRTIQAFNTFSFPNQVTHHTVSCGTWATSNSPIAHVPPLLSHRILVEKIFNKRKRLVDLSEHRNFFQVWKPLFNVYTPTHRANNFVNKTMYRKCGSTDIASNENASNDNASKENASKEIASTVKCK